MRSFKRTRHNRVTAEAIVSFDGSGGYDLAFDGYPEPFLHAPAYYLDWALERDGRTSAAQMVATLTAMYAALSVTEPKVMSWLLLAERSATKEVTARVSVTNFGSVATFRPRVAVTTHLYATFGALWDGVVERLVSNGDLHGIAALLDEMRSQLRAYTPTEAHAWGVSRKI